MTKIGFTSNLAEDLLAILIISFVLATQEWLSILGNGDADVIYGIIIVYST